MTHGPEPLPGVMLGHAHDAAVATGVTAVVFASPAVASACVLGGAPGGSDTGLLDPAMTVERVDALVLAGGSAFGLAAMEGARRALHARGRGLAVGPARVPIVPGAILFDLTNGGDKAAVTGGDLMARLGVAAVEAAASGPVPLGSVGAGHGATTATLKGGFGAAEAPGPGGARVLALAAVNALGSATVGDGPWFWAGPFEQGAEFGGLGLPSPLPPGSLAPRVKGGSPPSTTLAVVVTDAALTKPQARRLAVMAHGGLARSLRPCHAPMDGDTVFAAATATRPGEVSPHDLGLLGLAAADALARAVARGVFEATALPFPGALPSWRDRFADRAAGC